MQKKEDVTKKDNSRIIKFRAWEGDRMIEWHKVRLMRYIQFEVLENVEQFTGLKDKNGKEIYEGDIVDCDMSYKGGALPHRGKIVFNKYFGAFATKNEGGETLIHNHIVSSFEVIGNIHENKDLLK